MKGSYSRLLSDDELDAIARRYRRGETVAELAVAYAVSTAPIRNALRIREVETRDLVAQQANHRARKRRALADGAERPQGARWGAR